MGDKYNLVMVEEPNSEGEDTRGGPCINKLPSEIVKYLTDPNAIESPFVDSSLPLAYGVFGVRLFG
ncbi:putative zinc metalloprotease egy1, chloroplastic [Castilleja foliolosa]|uniref:Zinc metalloprotease egy1, chloroplastic n=1 Tax=Castilleja foliolosa TaxID=1961234 RepID=A0ABD3D470_9LAMI